MQRLRELLKRNAKFVVGGVLLVTVLIGVRISNAQNIVTSFGIWFHSDAATQFNPSARIANGYLTNLDATTLAGSGRTTRANVRGGFGTWQHAGALNTARDSGGAVTLTNGKALVVGGETYNGNSLASCELFDPATGVWTLTGSLHTARQNIKPVLLPDGKVLVAGGMTGNSGAYSAVDTAEIYDPAAGTWTVLAATMVHARENYGAVLMGNGLVLITGGANFAPWTFRNTAELYDPATQTFAATTNNMQNTARSETSTTLLQDGRVLIAGGPSASHAVDIYNPSTGLFTVPGQLNYPRAWPSGVLLPNGKVLIVGGQNDITHVSILPAELFDPVTDTFSVTGSLTQGSLTGNGGSESAFLLEDGNVIFFSGYDITSGEPIATAQLYKTNLGIFVPTGSLSNARFGNYSVKLLDGRILTTGGCNVDFSSDLSSTEIYRSPSSHARWPLPHRHGRDRGDTGRD